MTSPIAYVPPAPRARRAELLQLVFGFAPAQILHTLVELGVPEAISDRSVAIEDLAEATGTEPRSLRRLLRAAASLGLVYHLGSDTVQLSARGALLRPDVPGSVRNLVVLWAGDNSWQAWGRLDWSVRTGRPAYETVTGAPFFDYLDDHPEDSAVFDRAMTETTMIAAPGIAAAVNLWAASTVADIGGGNGVLLAKLLETNGHVKGILFDRPASTAAAAARFAAEGLTERVTVVSGDFFEEVPPGADVYLLKSVLHDWNDDEARTILTNCAAAMAEHATLLIIEPVVPDTDDQLVRERFMVISDLNMMVCTGGVERTVADFGALLADCGLAVTGLTRCEPPSNLSVIHVRHR